MARDRARAEEGFRAALDAPARRFWYGDYGSSLRDQAAIAVMLKESGLLPDRLQRLVASLPGADLNPVMLSTQEQAWTIAAAAALGRDGRVAQISLNGADLPRGQVVSVPVRGPATARNQDERPVWVALSVTGVPAQPLPAARNMMQVRRFFHAMDGKPLNLDQLKQNTVFVLVIEGRAEDGQEHTAQLLQGLPAGWEIVGRFGADDTSTAGLPWLGKLTETQAQPAADDRFAAVLDLPANMPNFFRVAVKLRAVTPGSFELPGAELSDMYRPAIYARQNAGRVNVLPLE
jgi:uncharacterized protein YfaS (alpha-2-macroglobulin family)